MTWTTERMALYDRVALACSRTTTRAYSTSFSWCIRTLPRTIRGDIYAIYGFVRFADEIVDSFLDSDQAKLLDQFQTETYRAVEERVSTNPILHAFQRTYHRYGIERWMVERFLQSMTWDLERSSYDRDGFDGYVVGSAEVVGLMCLKVFVQGDEAAFDRLRGPAERLGAAFQKVNFLRDLREDVSELGRVYFPDLDLATFDDDIKRQLEAEIADDLGAARDGIRELPGAARLGVYTAYVYYQRLLHRIQAVPAASLMMARVRVSNGRKAALLAYATARHALNLI